MFLHILKKQFFFFSFWIFFIPSVDASKTLNSSLSLSTHCPTEALSPHSFLNDLKNPLGQESENSTTPYPVFKSLEDAKKILPKEILKKMLEAFSFIEKVTEEEAKTSFQTELESAEKLIDLIGQVYEKMGLSVENYHNQAHNLAVTFGMMILVKSSAQEVQDVKVAFLAAILHDFHLRTKIRLNEKNEEKGTAALVEETMKQIDYLLSILNENVPIKEFIHLSNQEFKILDKQATFLVHFQTLIRSFLRVNVLQDINPTLQEIKTMIFRTDFPSNVSPADPDSGVKQKTIKLREQINESIVVNAWDPSLALLLMNLEHTKIFIFIENWGSKKLLDLKATLDSEKNYEKIIQINNAIASLPKNVENTKIWVERQFQIEKNYLESLAKIYPERRQWVHVMANQLEKGADQSSYYWVGSISMILEIIKGLGKELPFPVSEASSYPFFFYPELLRDPVYRILKNLPQEYKENFFSVLEHFASKSMILDKGEETLTPLSYREWQEVKSSEVKKALELPPNKTIIDGKSPVVSIFSAAA